jgi:hypothetical protein
MRPDHILELIEQSSDPDTIIGTGEINNELAADAAAQGNE